MDYFSVAELKKLQGFFSFLSEVNFNLNRIPPIVLSHGTPLNKAECLNLLREFPELKGLKDEELVGYLANPKKVERLLEKLAPEQRFELEKPFKQQTITTEANQQSGEQTAGQTIPTNATGTSADNVPFSMPSAPRVIYNIPHTQTPQVEAAKSDIVIANKSGAVAGERSSGIITKTPPPEIYPANNSGVVIKEHSISAFKKIQGFSSPAGPFLKINLGRLGRGIAGAIKTGLESANPFLGRMGTGLANNLTSIAQPGIGGAGGASRSFFGKIGRLGKSGGSGTSVISKAKGKGGLVFAISLIGFMLLAGGLTAFAPSPTPGEAAPISGTAPGTTTVSGVTYTLPLKEVNINPKDISAEIIKAFPKAKLEYWDLIVQESKDNGWNPALILTLWIEETGASERTKAENGGGGVSNPDGTLAKGHLGCAPWEDQTIKESLTCIFKFGAENKFTNDQFPQFMAKYSNSPGTDPFAENPNFVNNVKNWYTQLVPSGIGTITIITNPPSSTPYNPGGGSEILSCPMNQGTVVYGSKETGGHCSGGYEYDCILPGQPGYTGRETAVDIQGSSRTVYFPYLAGASVDWVVNEADTPINNSEGGGIAVAATASSNGKSYKIRFVHIASTNLAVGQKIKSATEVGQHVVPSAAMQSFANHVHVTAAEDGVYKPADLYFNLCK